MQEVATHAAWLIPLPGGPPLEPLKLTGAPEGQVLGRHEQCLLRLPPEIDKISRQHARFAFDGGQWTLTDLQSRWGTFLNGVKIPPHRPMTLSEGDHVRIVPWTFSFTTRGLPHRSLKAVDDSQTTGLLVRSLPPQHAAPLHEDLLNLLLESAATIHASEEEAALAEALIDVACRGTGLPNAAFVRPLDAQGRIEVVASRSGPSLHPGEPMGFSRSLLSAASEGTVAELSGETMSGEHVSQSIVQMKIDAAICVPLMLGSSVARYLYLDARGGKARLLRPNAARFCQALGQMASLALANLKRLEVERRTAKIEAELNAAHTAQKWILPRGELISGPFRCIGESRPGEYVGGDFFDLLVLDDGRLMVALGDVTGHGIAASVLMTATQGFLHAAMMNRGDLGQAVTDLNQFVHPRRPANRFVTLWAAVLNPADATIRYVDAGHGYALLGSDAQSMEPLRGEQGFPLGIEPDSRYEAATVPLSPHGRLLVISDGLVEQPAGDSSGHYRQFSLEGVKRAMASGSLSDNPIQQLFQAVFHFAGTESLADDATAVEVSW